MRETQGFFFVEISTRLWYKHRDDYSSYRFDANLTYARVQGNERRLDLKVFHRSSHLITLTTCGCRKVIEVDMYWLSLYFKRNFVCGIFNTSCVGFGILKFSEWFSLRWTVNLIRSEVMAQSCACVCLVPIIQFDCPTSRT
jgi:hypothetical protein